MLYILDEPSIGLHPRDNDRLLDTLCDLRDLGNTVVVVEHDEDTMRAERPHHRFRARPGCRGGEVVAQGSVAHVTQAAHSLTGRYLSGKRRIEIPAQRRMAPHTQPTIDLDAPVDRHTGRAATRSAGISSRAADRTRVRPG